MPVQYTDSGLVSVVQKTQEPAYGRLITGYGGKVPTRYMVKYAGRWKRVYAMVYGNSSSLYIIHKVQDLFIDQTTEERLTEIAGY